MPDDPATFLFDVFLSHSEKDKPIVRPLAERLRADGLKVWFDEWEIKPGDNIPHKIEEGLESSRLLILCMSAHAFGSDWAQLESQTFRFRDPLNKDRRFLPLRLDNTPVKASLLQFLTIDFTSPDSSQSTIKLLESCHPLQPAASPVSSAHGKFAAEFLSVGHTAAIRSVAFSSDGKWALSSSDDYSIRLWDTESGRCVRAFNGHTGSVWSVAWSPDGRRAISGAGDTTVRVWDIESGRCLHVLQGHTGSIWCAAWSQEGDRAFSGASDHTVRLWEIESGRCLRVFEGHSGYVTSVAWSSDGSRAISGNSDKTLRLWEIESGRPLLLLEGHSGYVSSLAWSFDGCYALSGASDHTVRLWQIESGHCLRVFEGHSGPVFSVAWSSDGRHAVSASSDRTVRLWEIGSGRCLRILEAHSGPIHGLALSSNGSRVLSGASDYTVRLWEFESGHCLRTFEGHSGSVDSVAWSPDGSCVLSGSSDQTARLWEIKTGRCLGVLTGHSGYVWSAAWNHDGSSALTGSSDHTLRLWEIDSRRCLRVLKGHSGAVSSLAWSPDGRYALSGSSDHTLRLWEVETGRCLHVLEGHHGSIDSVAWSPDGTRALSGASDFTVRLWETRTGRCLHVLEGHSGLIREVAWSPDGSRALSGSADYTVRLWEIETGRCLHVLEGHSGSVRNVAWGSHGRRVLSWADDKTVRLWESETGRCLRILKSHLDSITSIVWSSNRHQVLLWTSNGVMRLWSIAAIYNTISNSDEHPEDELLSAQLQYTNAKVLMVGESGAGKTGLSKRLALGDWESSDSTVGAWATQWKLPVEDADGVEREIWLWDFGGQADQRLIHQLYMDETALAIHVFDGQKEDVFEALGQWDRDLSRASRRPFTKILAAGRVDAGGVRISRTQIEAFRNERTYTHFLETSAKTGQGCEDLKKAILTGIRWENIPWRSSPILFKRLKEEIIKLKDDGRALLRFNELREALQLSLTGGDTRFTNDELKTVIGLLAGPGIVWELEFGSWILLQPERLNAYAQAVIQTMRDDEHERGCLAEELVLDGNLTYHYPNQRLSADEERFVLLAMHKLLVERGLCLREHTETGTILIFPSYYRRERPELIGHPAALVSYRFNGFLDDIYATLVVRLHHTKPFNQDKLWHYAADFTTASDDKQLGIKLERRAEGAAELVVYADPAIATEEKILFTRYVHEHLLQKGTDTIRLRHYCCPHCGTPVGNRETAMKRLNAWLNNLPPEPGLAGKIKAATQKPDSPTILCVECEDRVPLWDEFEQFFASDEIKIRVRQLQEESDLHLDNESKDRALVGDVISTVALAGQISREFTVSDHGIDMEIEFKNDAGQATGKKLYLQLKSGDSHLRKRKTTETEVFPIKDERHLHYWMNQAFPVLLVVAGSEGHVRWMEIRDWLKTATNNGQKSVKQIEFTGERFDVMSVRRWRDKVLGTGGI